MTLLLTPAAANLIAQWQMAAGIGALDGKVDFIPAMDPEAAADHADDLAKNLEAAMFDGTIVAIDGKPCVFDKPPTPARRGRVR